MCFRSQIAHAWHHQRQTKATCETTPDEFKDFHCTLGKVKVCNYATLKSWHSKLLIYTCTHTLIDVLVEKLV